MMTDTVVTVQDTPSCHVYNFTQRPPIRIEFGWHTIFPGITTNLHYLKTIPGIIKIVELVLGIFCILCANPLNVLTTICFQFVVLIVFMGTFALLFAYTLSLDKKMKLPFNWYLFELLYTALITFVYATAFILQLSAWSPLYDDIFRTFNIAAGVFGIFNTIAYAVGTYFLYLEWKNTNTQ